VPYLPPRGVEQIPDFPQENAIPPESGAPGGALLPEMDPDLARVVEAWPRLPAHVRRAVLAMVEKADTKG